MWLGILLGAAVASGSPGAVLEVGPAVLHRASPRAAASAQAPAFAAVRLPEGARHALGPLSIRERTPASAQDMRGRMRPKTPAVRIGVSRSLPGDVGFEGLSPLDAPGEPRVVGGGWLERDASGRRVWTAAFSSEGAAALRLHLRDAHLPAGSLVFVYSAAGEAHGPYTFEGGTRPEGFWTNTVFAAEIFLEVQVPAGASGGRLFVDAVVHIEPSAFAPPEAASESSAASLRPKSQTCFIDASCVTTADFPNVDSASHAVAQLTFVDGGSAFVCSGGLLNATPSTLVPYLLTAQHCFDNQAAATSLEAVWNYKTATCGGPFPSPSLFPRTLGSTLLATGLASDFTFVQLSQDPPDGSVFLGWSTADYSHAGGTILYRLSHPAGNPQFYTREEISAVPTPISCGDAPQGDFLYEKDVAGGTGGGSSGSPVYLADLRVVGQEGGACGTNQNDDCDVVANSTVDGAFFVTYPSVQPWLAPSATGPCVADATTLCLNANRFRVSVQWETKAGAHGPGTAVSLTGDSGYFWFFNPANIELVVKVLDACAIAANRHWVFAGGLTNVSVAMTVQDTQTGALRMYSNPLGTAFAPLQDTQAFVCP